MPRRDTHIRVSPEVRKRVMELCAMTNLSASKVIEWLLDRYEIEFLLWNSPDLPPPEDMSNHRYVPATVLIWLLEPIAATLNAILEVYPDLRVEAGMTVNVFNQRLHNFLQMLARRETEPASAEEAVTT